MKSEKGKNKNNVLRGLVPHLFWVSRRKRPETLVLPKKGAGFTMPEMLISIGLFTVIIAATSSAFLIGLRTQRQIIALLNANDNMSYALEVMARDIRTGRSFFSPLEENLNFLNYKNEAVVYRLNNGAIERAIGSGEFEPLTSSNIRVLKLSFRLEGQKRYDDRQVRITIVLKIASRYGNQEIITDLETTISPRELET